MTNQISARSTDHIDPVRMDLVGDSDLLTSISSLLEISGVESSHIVVSAPHHASGSSPVALGHDENTGIFAQCLADKLAAKCIVVSELRSFIDINKDPFSTDNLQKKAGFLASKRMKLFYQSQLLSGLPRLIIELHGHTSGKYDIEISPGTDLTPSITQDAISINALRSLRHHLIAQLPETAVSVGVYPLDRDTHFQAKNTYTFQRIEWLRQLGLPIAGLHIEIHKKLRETYRGGCLDEKNIKWIQALAEGLILFQSAMKSAEKVRLDSKSRILELFETHNVTDKHVFNDKPFTVQMAPMELVSANAVLINHLNLQMLGIDNQDRILISKQRSGLNPITVMCMEGSRKTDTVSMPKRFRDILGVNKGDYVYIGRYRNLENEEYSTANVFFVGDTLSQHNQPEEANTVWISPGCYDAVIGTNGEREEIVMRLIKGRGQHSVNVQIKRMEESTPDYLNHQLVMHESLAKVMDLVVGDLVLVFRKHLENKILKCSF